MRAELVAIGSELLRADRADTNGAWLAARLEERGIPVRHRSVVGDDEADIAAVLGVALGRSDLVVATGGLGPTVDDRTREAAAAALGLPLRDDPAILLRLEARFREYGRPMSPQNRRQAQVPEGAEVLANRHGTAPGLLFRAGAATIVLLPGVPAEMRQMFEDEVLPRLPGAGGVRLVRRVLKVAGLPESEVDHRLEPVARAAGGVEWTILAAPGQVEIHLREAVADDGAAAGIDRLDRAIEAILGPHLFARDAGTIEEVVGALLLRSGATLALAESLTGGGIGARITSVPGASRYFLGGVVCYSDAAKRAELGVGDGSLKAHGAVSREVAIEMARGVRARMGATWGVAATGYAGPEGGCGQPPGTVALAVSGPGGERAALQRYPGDRQAVRRRAGLAALDLLRLALLGVPA